MADTLVGSGFDAQIGTRALPGQTQTEFYNKSTGQGFSDPNVLSSYVNQNFSGANVNAGNVFDVLKSGYKPISVSPSTVNPSSILGSTPRTGLDIQSLINQNLQKQTDVLSQIQNYFTPTAQEQAAQQQYMDLQGKLNDAQTTGEKTQLSALAGLQNIENQVIPMEAITGQQASLQRQANLALQTNAVQQNSLSRQQQVALMNLQNMQASRQSRLESAKFLYDSTRNSLKDTLDLYQATAPQNIGTQVNQTTGDVYVVTRNPITGETSTTVAGNVGAQKSYVSSQMIQDASGNYFMAGVKPDGSTEVVPLGIQGASQSKYITVDQFDNYGNKIGQQLYDTTTGQYVNSGQGGTPGQGGGGGSSKLNASSTLNNLLGVWVNGNPDSPAGYASSVAKDLGINVNTPIAELSNRIPELAKAIARYEGYKPGSTNIPTRLNNPGNLVYTGQSGAVPMLTQVRESNGKMGTRTFAKFSTPEAGFAALENDLRAKISSVMNQPQGQGAYASNFVGPQRPDNFGSTNNDPNLTAAMTKQQFPVDIQPAITNIGGRTFVDLGKLDDKQSLVAKRIAGAMNIPVLTAKESTQVKTTLQTIEQAKNIVGQINQLASKINFAPTGLSRPGYGLANTLKGWFGNTDINLYTSKVDSMLSMLSRATGEKGVLTDQDVARIKNGLPKLSDTTAVKRQKLQTFNELFNSTIESALNTYVGPLQNTNVISQGSTASGLKYQVIQ